MPFNQKLSKSVRACRHYSLPKLARFLRYSIIGLAFMTKVTLLTVLSTLDWNKRQS